MTVLGLVVVMAHQSDWLSMVLVLIPLAVFSWILFIANRRAQRDGIVPLGTDAYDHEEIDDAKTWH